MKKLVILICLFLSSASLALAVTPSFNPYEDTNAAQHQDVTRFMLARVIANHLFSGTKESIKKIDDDAYCQVFVMDTRVANLSTKLKGYVKCFAVKGNTTDYNLLYNFESNVTPATALVVPSVNGRPCDEPKFNAGPEGLFFIFNCTVPAGYVNQFDKSVSTGGAFTYNGLIRDLNSNPF